MFVIVNQFSEEVEKEKYTTFDINLLEIRPSESFFPFLSK